MAKITNCTLLILASTSLKRRRSIAGPPTSGNRVSTRVASPCLSLCTKNWSRFIEKEESRFVSRSRQEYFKEQFLRVQCTVLSKKFSVKRTCVQVHLVCLPTLDFFTVFL